MSNIKVMSENLANKIAAGEVVEKCASVVKELVENSIDAKSDDIKVDLLDGGLTSIKVSDNGIGMDKEDALLAFSRHATSKLKKEDDLFFINTLGFRGEALPSIASVSNTDLETSIGDVGTHIVINGGKLSTNEDIAKNKGTTITISNLFYNTPARLKYLKSEQYELANITSYIEKLALSNPNISFQLTNNNKIILKTSGSNDLLKTIHEVYGLNVSSKMVEINANNDDFTIKGYICKPEILRSNRNDMNVFVNGRIVKNYEINRIINDAYKDYKPDKRYPIVVLNIYVDPTLIDVNIHPTKQDIKIAKFNNLYTLLLDSIEDALKDKLLVQDALLRLPDANKVKQEIMYNVEEEKEEYKEININKEIVGEQTSLLFEDVEEPSITSLDLNPIGQIHNTFIVAQNEEGMYLIDQHAAAERINYEKVQDAFKTREFYEVPLLVPITIELPTSSFIIIKENMDYLKELGFNIEEFGMNTININSHPSWINNEYSYDTVKAVIDMIIEDKNKFSLEKFEERLMQTIACRMSLMANTELNIEEMKELLDNLKKCKNPYNCAHGRPSIMNFNNYELNRMFKRAMN